MEPENLDKFLSWARYLYWSDILYLRWQSFADTEEPNPREWQSFALCAQWLASVWVVVEGWKKTQLIDPVINKLLDEYPDCCDLLRRFRNGVYHFQPNIFDARLTALPTNGQETLMWVYALFYEFKRFFWEWPDTHHLSQNEKEELHQLIHHAVGWKPTDILHARIEELNRMKHDGERMISISGDHSSLAAQELLSAIAQIDNLIQDTDRSPILNVLTRINPRH